MAIRMDSHCFTPSPFRLFPGRGWCLKGAVDVLVVLVLVEVVVMVSVEVEVVVSVRQQISHDS